MKWYYDPGQDPEKASVEANRAIADQLKRIADGMEANDE